MLGRILQSGTYQRICQPLLTQAMTRFGIHRGWGTRVLPAASSYLDMFDDEDTLLSGLEHPAYGAIRVPDGRALAWAEYGSSRGLPCVLIPDAGSSRLSPAWLLHDSALPSSVRLLALDRPGTGASDPIGLGSREDPADDLARLVDTLAVGRVAVIGIGQGADEAFAFAIRHPQLVTAVTAVSVRPGAEPAPRRGLLRRRPDRSTRPNSGAIGRLLAAAGHGADLRDEQTWVKAAVRLDAEARALIGDRWKEPDFRAAVAADVAEGGHAWAGIAKPAATPEWVSAPGSVDVPVQFWHGQQESPTTLSDVRGLAADRPRWTVSAVAGASAAMGFWPQILSSAAASFSTVRAA